MNKTVRMFLVSMMFLGFSTIASAQATRTWVSGVGDDVNPCSRTAPCKTFAGAISKTAAGGEISVLDPGGFGAVTITKSMIIDGAGQLASTLFSGTNGFLVNDSATATPGTIEVTLRNLTINGGNTGVDGVRFISGKKVAIENCIIFNGTGDGVEVLTTATSPNAMLHIRNTTIEKMATGLNIHPTSAFTLNVTNSNITRITGGAAGDGIFLNGPVTAVVSNTTISNCANAGVNAASTSQVTLDGVRSASNVFGMFNSGGTPTTRLKDSVFVGNSSVGVQNNGGTITSFSSNVIVGASGVITKVAPD